MELDISVVIPVYNEAQNISSLHTEIIKTLNTITSSYEVIYVDDGSTDNTRDILEKLPKARPIYLPKNLGQSIAFTKGFDAAKGTLVISLDGDGQNDPKDIPLLINTLKTSDVDVVSGWRKQRKDPVHITLISFCGRILRKIFFNDSIHDAGCSLRVYKQKTIKGLDLKGKKHSYLLLILRSRGYTIREVEVNHRPRVHGESKYNAGKIFPGLVELLRLRMSGIYNETHERTERK